METRVLIALVFAARWVIAGESDTDARIVISDLLDPAKRMVALQAFIIRTDPDFAKEMEWNDRAKFAARHQSLEVRELPTDAPDGVRVLVIFDGDPPFSFDAWPAESEARVFAPKPGEPLIPFREVNYYRFTADGHAIDGANAEMCWNASVGDFNNDGRIDIIEYKGGNGIPGLDSEASAGLEFSYAVIRPAGRKEHPVFAVLYDTHPRDRVEVEPWAGQLIDEDGDGVFDFQIGPRIEGRIKPEVTFVWNAARGTWVGPEAGKGAHFRTLDPANVADDIQRIARAGGLGYAAELKPKDERVGGRSDTIEGLAENLSADEVSKPYRYASLAGLTDEQVLDWMVRRRTVWDVAAERMDAAAHLPKLWELDPKAAALAYALAHRPPATRANSRHTMDDLDDHAAPDEGTVTVSDGPSGCFAPSGAFVHMLHCAPGDSYLIFAGSIRRWWNVSLLGRRTVFDFRKVPLSDAEARQALQIVWWLSRVRARPPGGPDGESGMSSTSDGFASVQVDTPRTTLRIDAKRFDGSRGSMIAIGNESDDYDQTAFLNLVVYFFNHDLAEHLGARWPEFEMWEREKALPGSDPYPPGERERIEHLSAEWVRMFLRHEMPHEVASVALEAVREFGLKSLRADVARMAGVLPPPTPAEQRFRALDAAMANWKMKHGAKGTDISDVYGRAHPPDPNGTATTTPGLELLADASPVPKPSPPDPKSPKPKSDPRYAEFDALYTEQEALSMKRQPAEGDIARLRDAIATTLRQLDSWNDARALGRWALEDEMGCALAIPRLAQIDRKRACEVLRHYAAILPAGRRDDFQTALENETGEIPKNECTSARLARKAKLAPADITALLKILRDAKSSIEVRQSALRTLVPPGAPGKYPSPEIDRVLLGSDATKGSGFDLIGELADALALRLGPKAWDRLVELSVLAVENNLPKFCDVVPALTLLAQRNPALFREPLARLLEPQFTETNGDLDTMFWSAWRAELRVLKPALEKVATSSTDDAEGSRASSYSSEKSPVNGRFHLARQIVSIWNEEDALTGARLLVAFGIAHPDEVMDNGAEPMRAHLQAVAELLDAEQRATVLAFHTRSASSYVVQSSFRPASFSDRTVDPVRAFSALLHSTFEQR